MEKQFGRIVVGDDGSPAAAHALDWAAREAGRRGRPLTVLSVVDYSGIGVGPAALGYAWPEAARESCREIIEKGSKRARALAPDVEVAGVTVAGAAAAVLIEASRTAELVVVGTRGHGALGTLVLGSVAASVAAHGRCPVVIVRGSGDVFPDPQRPVVVGVDGSPAAQAALALAASTAEQAGASLTVVCAWNALVESDWVGAYSRGMAPESPDLRPGERQLAQAALDAAVSWVRAEHPAVAVTPVLAEGPPAQALVEAGADAGLVVVGTRGHGAFTSLLLGSVSHGVVHAATVPVAVVRGEMPAAVQETESEVPVHHPLVLL